MENNEETIELCHLQQLFVDAIYGEEEGVLPALQLGGVSAAAKVAIYRNNVFTNLGNVLKACYPVVEKLVGEEFFRFLALHYIKHYKPLGGNLAVYGGHMAEFLGKFPPVAELPYLMDVARLEWACHLAYHAEDGELFPAAALAQIAPEHYSLLQFSLHPSCYFITSLYPLYRIWEVNQPGYEGKISVDLGTGGSWLLVLRAVDYTIKIIPLSKAEYMFLYSLQLGANLYQAYENAEKEDSLFNLSEVITKNVANNVFLTYKIEA